mgnify:FL=1
MRAAAAALPIGWIEQSDTPQMVNAFEVSDGEAIALGNSAYKNHHCKIEDSGTYPATRDLNLMFGDTASSSGNTDLATQIW